MAHPPTSGDDRTAAAQQAIAQLRELTREAHGAIRDLSRMLTEIRRLTAQGAMGTVEAAMETRVNAAMTELNAFLAREAKRATRQVTTEMERTRRWIVDNLQVSELIETKDGCVVKFTTTEL